MSARDVLHAWVCGEYVGRFERDFDMDKPRFVQAVSSERVVSLSLRGVTNPNAAGNFLAALVPEREADRKSVQRATGAPSRETWDLLTAIGGDLPGGVVLATSESTPTQNEEPYSRVATEGAIASRISDIKAGGSAFDQRYGSKPRFSLAGAQGKFALVTVAGQSFWSDSVTPSTHILKPESAQHAGLELVEAATLDLARLIVLQAPDSAQVSYSGETTFQIQRFDRCFDAAGDPQRIHAEDMTQALGVGIGEKYSVGPDEITAMLRRETGDDELGYEFYRQYAFNAIIGNADAHGKNYSLLHQEGSITLSPLYDAIPVGMFPEYGQSLAMPVGYMDHFLTIAPDDWTESAVDAGLDPERVRLIVQEVADGVREHLDTTVGAVRHSRVSRRALDEILESADRQTGDIPAKGA